MAPSRTLTGQIVSWILSTEIIIEYEGRSGPSPVGVTLTVLVLGAAIKKIKVVTSGLMLPQSPCLALWQRSTSVENNPVQAKMFRPEHLHNTLHSQPKLYQLN